MDKLDNLKNYQYNSIDNSIISKKLLTPFHNKIITLIPMWISPNLLTLLGFTTALSAFILTLITDHTLSNQKNRIIFLINAILIFLYQTFDAIDGKQARRLGASSPLGQLFDHGCDMFVNLFICTSLASAMGFGIGANFLFSFLSFLTVYFVCCAEEYFIEEFHLGCINGPSEGILAAILIHLYAFMFGNDYIKLLYNFKIWIIAAPLFVCLLLISSTFLITTIKILIYRKHGTKMKVLNMMFNGYLVIISTVLNSFHSMLSGDKEFYFLLITCTFIMGRLTLDILYSHLKRTQKVNTDMMFKVYVFGSPFLLVFKVNYMFLFMIFAASIYFYLERALYIKNEICEYLGISLLTVDVKSKTD